MQGTSAPLTRLVHAYPQVAHQGVAVLGLATVAMSEELGTAMAHRALEHLLQYGEPPVRCNKKNP